MTGFGKLSPPRLVGRAMISCIDWLGRLWPVKAGKRLNRIRCSRGKIFFQLHEARCQ